MRRFTDRIRQRAGSIVEERFFRWAAAAGKLHPMSKPERHNVEVTRDVRYLDTGREEHRLDVYRPIGRPGPLPVVLYIHGGAFRILSKDTHWIMALAFARRGFVVFNISYRLAPRHPFPAALEDAAAAYRWVLANAAAHGGDPARLVLAGESAGANLSTALAIAACYRRPEPFARRVFALGHVPRAVLPACGLLQVSDAERFARRKGRKLPAFISDRILEASQAYLRGHNGHGTAELADPLVVLERGERPERPLPPFFAPVGTADPLLDDTRRLKTALDRIGVPCEARYYQGELHAFHALVFRKQAQACWRHTFEFLAEHLGMELPARGPVPRAW